MAAEFNVNILPFNQSGTFSCSQYDVGRTATITLLDEGGEYTIPTGATVTINATKPSGFGFSEECSWSGSTVTIETTATMTEEAGKFPAELRITSGDTVLVSANFLFRVEESAHPDNVVDGDAETAQALTIRVTALESDVADLKSAISGGVGISAEVKAALLNCFENVAWINDDGQDYYDALEAALYPPTNLVSISAVYTQSGTVYDTYSLDDLKSDLVVTAHYTDSSTGTVTNYTLSGTLTVGTSTITVAYGGKTTTFNVTVTEYVEPPLYGWDFTQSLTDYVEGVTALCTATETVDGIKFEADSKYIVLNPGNKMVAAGKRIEIDIASMTDATSTTGHGRLFNVTTSESYATNANADSYVWRQNDGWYVYNGSWSSTSLSKADYPGSYFSGKTVVLEFDSSGYLTVSVGGTELITYTSAFTKEGYFVIGGSTMDYLVRLTAVISGIRIY